MLRVFYFSLFFLISGCAQQTDYSQGQSQWDFDHELQFSEKRLTNNTYYIEIIPNKRTDFNRLATFLMRRSMQLCQSYGFKVEVLKGVEEFDDKRSFPNLIMSRLAANVECSLQ